VSARYPLDLRSLALFRICLGALLIADLLDRSADLSAHYTDAGVLPRAAHRALFGGFELWSVHLWFDGARGQALLFGLAAAAALLLLLGRWTPLATLASWLLLASLHHRQPFVLTGGDSLLLLLLFWALFLPLGARWSLDARHGAARGGDGSGDGGVERSAASTALVAQILIVYLLAALLKLEDPSWRRLTALAESFGVEGVATDLARALLGHPALLRAATLATLAFELLAPWLIFSPWRTPQVRAGVVLAFLAFHLLGARSTLALGLVPYAMATAWIALLPPWFWERVLPRGREPVAAPRPAPRRGSARARELAVWLLLALVIADAAGSLDRPAWRRLAPEALRSAVLALGLFQNWALWSTPVDNRYYVFPAHLRDGEEIDLHTGRALDWSAPRPRSQNAHWWKYQLHLSRPYAAGLRRFYAAWLAREWNREQPPERRVAQLEIVQLSGPWDAPRERLRRTRLWP